MACQQPGCGFAGDHGGGHDHGVWQDQTSQGQTGAGANGGTGSQWRERDRSGDMSVKLLLIADTGRYPNGEGDVPCFYRAAAAHPDFAPLHLATEQINSLPSSQWCTTPVQAGLDQATFLQLGQSPVAPFNPEEIDAVFCRSLKPFAQGYLEVLQELEPRLRFLNRPSSKIQQLKPHFLSEIAGVFMPPHLVSSDPTRIEAFLQTHGEVVAKQGNSTQAQGVFRLKKQGKVYTVEHAYGHRSEQSLLT